MWPGILHTFPENVDDLAILGDEIQRERAFLLRSWEPDELNTLTHRLDDHGVICPQSFYPLYLVQQHPNLSFLTILHGLQTLPFKAFVPDAIRERPQSGQA